MATRQLVEDEGIFYALRERYGSVDAALASNPNIWGDSSSCGDESSLREALEGPQHDQIIAVLIGLAKAPPPSGSATVGPDIHGNMLRGRTETVAKDETISIHAEKNQDIEVENDETHFVGRDARAAVWDDTDIVHVLEDDGPSHLLGNLHGRVANTPGEGNFWGDDNGEIPFDQLKAHHITGGDFNDDGPDTVAVGDFNGDGMVDAADYVL